MDWILKEAKKANVLSLRNDTLWAMVFLSYTHDYLPIFPVYAEIPNSAKGALN
jgi:hypothetical protein